MPALLGLMLISAVAAQGSWRDGRATFYGNEPWLWSIHKGSCGYGYIWPNEGTGWDVTALPDAHPGYSGSCGRCYEVRCKDTDFTDKFGNKLFRKGVCYDPEASVVVRTTDSCPCNKADNYYSNQRWCCGDMDHLDLSIWAFEKLADTKWGVIGLQYREVSCGYKPSKVAPAPRSPFPGEGPEKYGISYQQSSSSETETEEEEYRPPSGDRSVFKWGISGGWWANHWKASVWTNNPGPNGSKAACANIYKGGAMSFKSNKGAFGGKSALEFWAQTNNGVPDVTISVGGDKGGCRVVKLQDLNSSEQRNGWSKYNLYFNLFETSTNPTVVAFDRPFAGCKGMQASDLTNIQFRNDYGSGQESMCIGDVSLLGQ